MSGFTVNEISKLINEQLKIATADLSKNVSDELAEKLEKLSQIEPNKMAGAYYNEIGNPLDDNKPKIRTGYNRKAKDLFGESNDTKGFKSLGECLLAIKNNDYNKLQHLEKDMTEGEGQAGGFLLPAQFSNDIIDMMLEEEICRPRCRTYSIKQRQGNSLTIPAVDDYDHSSSIAGISTYWIGEGQAYPESTNAKIRQISLKLNKLTCLVDTTEELLTDSAVSAENLLGGIFAKALSFEIDNCTLTNAGTGAGKPLSITNGNSIISVSGESGQTTDTIDYSNICNMVMRMTPSGFNNSIWLSSLSNIKQLLTLTVKLGTAGSWVKIFNEENGVWKILGRPVIFTEHCAVLGDAGNLKLLDLSRYAMLLREGIAVKADTSLGFKTDTVSFKANIRLDGQPIDSKVTTLKDGVTTVSPFIQLDTI